MSILDIVIFSLGGLCVAFYGFFAIRKTIKWRNRVKELVSKGISLPLAKEQANEEIYKKKKKQKTTDIEKDIPFEE